MRQNSGQFNRLSFFTHIDSMKRKLLAEGGERAAIIVPVLEQLQDDIDQWVSVKRFRRAYCASIAAKLHAESLTGS